MERPLPALHERSGRKGEEFFLFFVASNVDPTFTKYSRVASGDVTGHPPRPGKGFGFFSARRG